MADKSVKESAKKLLAARKAAAEKAAASPAPRTSRVAKRTDPVQAKATATARKTSDKTIPKTAPTKSAPTKPTAKAAAQETTENTVEKTATKKATKTPVKRAKAPTAIPVPDPDAEVLREAEKVAAPKKPTMAPRAAEIAEELAAEAPFETLERDLPRGGRGAMKVAAELGEEGLEKGAAAVGKRGMGRVMGRLGRLGTAGALGGVAGLGIDIGMDALMADDAGDADADNMHAAEVRQAEKSARLIPKKNIGAVPDLQEAVAVTPPKRVGSLGASTKPLTGLSEQELRARFKAESDRHEPGLKFDDEDFGDEAVEALPQTVKHTQVSAMHPGQGGLQRRTMERPITRGAPEEDNPFEAAVRKVMREEFKGAAGRSNAKPLSSFTDDDEY